MFATEQYVNRDLDERVDGNGADMTILSAPDGQH
jgi:hypothetical protein